MELSKNYNKNKFKHIIAIYGICNLLFCGLYMYLSSLPTNGRGIYFCALTKSIFHESTINGVGIIAILGWIGFVFYIIQTIIGKKRGTKHRPFHL